MATSLNPTPTIQYPSPIGPQKPSIPKSILDKLPNDFTPTTPLPKPTIQYPSPIGPQRPSGGGGGSAPATTNPSNDYVTPSFPSSTPTGSIYSGEKKAATSSPLIVTPQEAQRLRNTSTTGNYYTIQSNNIYDAIQEAPYISAARTTTPALGLTSRGLYTSNRAIINTYEQAFNNRNIMSTDFNAAYRANLAKADKDFINLPSDLKQEINAKGFLVGEVKGAVGLVEFPLNIAANLGVQTLKPGETPSFFGGRSLNIGGSLGQVSSYPNSKFLSFETAGKAAVIAPIVVEGVPAIYKGFSEGGFSGGFKNLASMFSPLKVKEGLYLRPSEPGKIVSYKGVNSEGVTTRIYKGVYESSDIYGYEVSKNGKGFGFIGRDTPAIEIKYGGSEVRPKLFTDIKTFEFSSKTPGTTKPFNPIIEVYKPSSGQISAISTYQGKGIREFSLSGSEYTPTSIKGIKAFRIGEGSSISKLSGTFENPIIEPTGNYKFKPQIKGLEVDFNSLRGSSSSSFSSGSSKLFKSFTFDSGLQAPVSLTKSLPSSSAVSPQLPKLSSTGGSSITLEIPKSITSNIPIIKNTQSPTTRTSQVPVIKTTTRQSQSFAPSFSIPQTINRPVQQSLVIPGVTQPSRTSTRLIQTPTFNTPSFNSVGFPFNPQGGKPFSFPKFPDFGGEGLISSSLRGGKRNTEYIPSLSAFVFNIRGKARRDITGLTTRPIPRRFKFRGFR